VKRRERERKRERERTEEGKRERETEIERERDNFPFIEAVSSNGPRLPPASLLLAKGGESRVLSPRARVSRR
jgi:hypothetical protein